jgi:hypothetical protein
MALIIIRNRKTGEGLKYAISDEWLPTVYSKPSQRRSAPASPAALQPRLPPVACDPYYNTKRRLTALRRSPPLANFHSFQNMLEY